MIEPKLLPNGNMLIPIRAEGENSLIGDSYKEVEPDSQEFKEWLPFISEDE